MQRGILLGILVLVWTTMSAAEDQFPLEKAPAQLCDQASLQRGAGTFMHYCSGCHSLSYARYNQLAKEIGIVDSDGNLLDDVAKQYLNLSTEKLTDNILSAMPALDAAKWFGVAPPDLTLIARYRGKDWLYTYLKSFYADPKRPWGVNNALFKDVAMPHVLGNLQGVQEAIIDGEGKIAGFRLREAGVLEPVAYDQVVADLVNFLDHVGEPTKLERKRIGGWVLLFLVILVMFTYLLKREYWKDVQ